MSIRHRPESLCLCWFLFDLNQGGLMAYADLTAGQKAAIDNYSNNLRAALGEAARLIRVAEILKAQYSEVYAPAVSSLTSGDEIPNNGGLAGASSSATKATIANWQSYLDTVVTDIGSSDHIGQMVAAAGAGNVLRG
jgi:hypothetical protein